MIIPSQQKPVCQSIRKTPNGLFEKVPNYLGYISHGKNSIFEVHIQSRVSIYLGNCSRCKDLNFTNNLKIF